MAGVGVSASIRCFVVARIGQNDDDADGEDDRHEDRLPEKGTEVSLKVVRLMAAVEHQRTDADADNERASPESEVVIHDGVRGNQGDLQTRDHQTEDDGQNAVDDHEALHSSARTCIDRHQLFGGRMPIRLNLYSCTVCQRRPGVVVDIDHRRGVDVGIARWSAGVVVMRGGIVADLVDHTGIRRWQW